MTKIKHKIFFILFLFAIFSSFSSAQSTTQVDSLKQKLAITTDDSLRAEINILLSVEFLYSDNSEALFYAEQALQISNESNLPFQKGRSHYLIGKVYRSLGDQNLALKNFLTGIEIFQKYNQAIKVADGELLIGSHYYNLNLPDNAIIYYNKALEIYSAEKDRSGESYALNNLGNCYKMKGNYTSAKKNYNLSLKIDESLKNSEGMAGSWVNLGTISLYEKKYSDAERYFNKSLKIYNELNDVRNTVICLINLGEIRNFIFDYPSALVYFRTAMDKAKSIGDEYLIKMCYYNLSFAYSGQNKFKEAYENLYEYTSISDSLNKKDLMNKLAELAQKYEFESKEREIKLLNEENKVAEQKNKIQELENVKQKAELAKSNTILIFSSGGIILLVVLALLLINRNRIKQRANQLLTQQKAEILEKSQIIEEKNNDILDSILYAKRIQDAIINEENKSLSILPQHFIFFKPKDIVSGDFYWSLKKGDHWYLAVVDCTGHGVPGAFMSMLGIAFLNEINSVTQLLSPAEILNELREKITRELGQTGSETENKDGMDMSLIRFDTINNLLEFSGAQNSIWIVRNKEIIELKADKQPVAFQPFQTSFTNHKMELKKKDVIYMFTDGYADQFGGPDLYGRPAGGKKFKYKRLRDMLSNSAHIDIKVQKELIERAFFEWKGDYEQIDDVSLIGIKI